MKDETISVLFRILSLFNVHFVFSVRACLEMMSLDCQPRTLVVWIPGFVRRISGCRLTVSAQFNNFACSARLFHALFLVFINFTVSVTSHYCCVILQVFAYTTTRSSSSLNFHVFKCICPFSPDPKQNFNSKLSHVTKTCLYCRMHTRGIGKQRCLRHNVNRKQERSKVATH